MAPWWLLWKKHFGRSCTKSSERTNPNNVKRKLCAPIKNAVGNKYLWRTKLCICNSFHFGSHSYCCNNDFSWAHPNNLYRNVSRVNMTHHFYVFKNVFDFKLLIVSYDACFGWSGWESSCVYNVYEILLP